MSDTNATKNALAASMKRLMQQRPFEKISVSDICADCGINRKSFYYHFRDKYDLVNWIFYNGFMTEIDLSRYENGWDLLEEVCRYFYRERAFYRAALRIEGQNSFKDYLIETAQPAARFFAQDILAQSEDSAFDMAFVADGLLPGIVRWLSGGYDHEMDAEEFLDHIKRMIQRIATTIE